MKPEQQVTSLELSQRLEKLGVKQESYFYWVSGEGQNKWVLMQHPKGWTDRGGTLESYWYKFYSAYTVAELGELLPAQVTIEKRKPNLLITKRHTPHISWNTTYCTADTQVLTPIMNEAFLAESLGEMLVFLIKNKIYAVYESNP